MMIPKVIHRIWFGPFKKLDDNKLYKQCTISLKQHLPGWDLHLWSDNNIEYAEFLKEYPFANRLNGLRGKSDLFRLYILYKYGGIYLDTDIELFKAFPASFLEKECFTFIDNDKIALKDYGYYQEVDEQGLIREQRRRPLTVGMSLGAYCIGATKEHPFIKECLDIFEKHSNAIQYLYINYPEYPTLNQIIADLAYDKGFIYLDKYQQLDNITIYESKYLPCNPRYNNFEMFGVHHGGFETMKYNKEEIKQMRFHVLGIPHTATNKDYSGCAFTQKVLNLCKMLVEQGHYVMYYGNELSKVECDEHIIVTHKEDILEPINLLNYDTNGPTYEKFNKNCIEEIGKRKESKDFLMCPWPVHKVIADQHPDLIVVESGIGYSVGHFAPFKIFESYAILHAYYGLKAAERANHFEWYSHVIPNYFDPIDFEYSSVKEDYLLFLGMRHGGEGKGYNIARDAARDAGIKLIVAGPDTPKDLPEHVEYVGLLGVEERKKYLSKAKALIAPSIFLEPFCGAQVEAFLSGTPVISSDWGAFVEYNIQGKTGFRCRTHWEFVNAIKNINEIKPIDCYNWAQQFTLEEVAKKYTEYCTSVMKIYTGKGWYEA